jgi:hypothetical protein
MKMIKIIKARWGIKEPIFELVCSHVDDIANLPNLINEEPFSSKGIGAGSTCICTENASVYMKSADDFWYLIEQKMGADFKNKMGETEIAGTWQFNDTLDHSGFDDHLSFTFDFYLNNDDSYVGKGIWTYPGFLGWFYSWGDGSSEEGLYDSSWMSGKAPTLTTSATVDSIENGELLLEWLNANATKIS